jgi:hypothetical protein
LTLTWSGEGQNFIDNVEGVDAVSRVILIGSEDVLTKAIMAPPRSLDRDVALMFGESRSPKWTQTGKSNSADSVVSLRSN